MEMKEKALPARSSRPSQGEGEIHGQGEGEIHRKPCIPRGGLSSVCDSTFWKLMSTFHPPSGRVAEEERRSGEGMQYLPALTEWSAMDGAKREGPPRSFLATLPRGG
jgi:hypothetical protein